MNTQPLYAFELVDIYAKDLIGRRVFSPSRPHYPGGVATVIEVTSPLESPEIAFRVRHPNAGENVIYANEIVTLQLP